VYEIDPTSRGAEDMVRTMVGAFEMSFQTKSNMLQLRETGYVVDVEGPAQRPDICLVVLIFFVVVWGRSESAPEPFRTRGAK
jgi:hypothetical protein